VSKLYANPIRVYLLLGFIALVGVYSGLRLPVSLFPNSSKPEVFMRISYGGSTAEEFLNTYGDALEEQLKKLSGEGVEVERVESTYRPQGVDYKIEFKWGVDPNAAQRETERAVNSFAARLPQEVRDSIGGPWLDNENTGFFAMSFYSETRDLNALYDLIEPMLGPRISQVPDAQDPGLWNPSRNEIRIELIPEAMASLQLVPRHIHSALQSTLGSYTGGSVTIGTNQLQVQIPRPIQKVTDLALVPIPTPSGRLVHLGDVSRINQGPKSMDSRSFKTSGTPSLILFATPKPGGNVKKMSEDMLAVVKDLAPQFPKDVKYRELVDPSEFIRSAVKNVVVEVGLAALLAVIVLFVFIGSFRNVITAAIEIPLSMVLAFILMRLTGMNLNLISLGGLALAAGMNVDASVVVMENIFRHFEMKPGPHDFNARLRIITEAVREVQFAILASTVASLVVFLPLTFTSALSYAILGDLAKAVVFSHGFSAIVALILVPTIRLQLMGREGGKPHHSIIERPLRALEEGYSRALGRFIRFPVVKWATYLGLAGVLVALVVVVFPKLPKEVIGTPDTDWMLINMNTQGNTLLRQMEQQAEVIERELLENFGTKIRYTFNQIRRPNQATLMARLKDKKDMQELWKAMEAHFSNTPFMQFWVGPWNPSELPIPDPPHMRLAIRSGKTLDSADTARALRDLIEGSHVYDRLSSSPETALERAVNLSPHFEQWEALAQQGTQLYPSDLADVLRVATAGRRVGDFPTGRELTEMVVRYPQDLVDGVETIEAFPLGVGAKIVPLKALATVKVQEAPPSIFRENLREAFLLFGRQNRGQEATKEPALAKAKEIVEKWEKSPEGKKATAAGVSVAFEDAGKDVTEAMEQLGVAIGLSVLLIFITLLVQFGSFVEPLLVLVSVPLGFIGVLVSLYVFKSTVSLNAALGVILLNGIAVANSIILVDFIKRLVNEGLSPRAAALEAARKRLRPILITSLTTVLGMLPIALGTGEGGHILQPLGIAVSGGLWVSTILTLFLVPALHVSYLEWRKPIPQLPPEPDPELSALWQEART
jgi:hydrophobic/amphiphilic exporter-1 (mainly G- bacteria), HAE1 family